MRYLVGAIVAGGLLMMPASLTAQEATALPPAGTLIVYVNSQMILPQMPGAAEAQQTFNQEVAAYQQEVQLMQAEVDSMLQVYQQQEAMLTQDIKETRQQEILEKQQQFQTRQQELEQIAGQRQTELLQPIVERLTGVIEQLRAENSYQVVFDVSSPGVVAADSALDITQAVLERVLQAAPPTATPDR